MTTLFENEKIIVEKNSSDEIFVKLKSNKVQLRVGDYTNYLSVTAAQCQIEPDAVNGLPAFRIKQRYGYGASDR